MLVPVQLLPTPAGLACSAIAVVLGAPLFADGLRAVRLRRRLGDLRRAPLETTTDGFVHIAGRVELDSPLFSPLSARPCAGFRLEVEAVGRPIRRHVEVRRGFRIVEAGVSARVPATPGTWTFEAGETRRVAPGDALSENLAALLADVPEVTWLRRSGATLVLTERVLFAGAECHVVGVARSAGVVAYAEETELLRTGTDDVLVVTSPGPSAAAAPTGAPHATDVAFAGGENAEFLLVSDREPRGSQLHINSIRETGIVLGPLLTMAGLFYLAAVADAMRAAGRF